MLLPRNTCITTGVLRREYPFPELLALSHVWVSPEEGVLIGRKKVPGGRG